MTRLFPGILTVCGAVGCVCVWVVAGEVAWSGADAVIAPATAGLAIAVLVGYGMCSMGMLVLGLWMLEGGPR